MRSAQGGAQGKGGGAKLLSEGLIGLEKRLLEENGKNKSYCNRGRWYKLATHNVTLYPWRYKGIGCRFGEGEI